MRRRGFLGGLAGIIAAGVAPAIVAQPMKIWVPKPPKVEPIHPEFKVQPLSEPRGLVFYRGAVDLNELAYQREYSHSWETDTGLSRDSAGILEVRDGLPKTMQELKVNKTYTDAQNYERAQFEFVENEGRSVLDVLDRWCENVGQPTFTERMRNTRKLQNSSTYGTFMPELYMRTVKDRA